MKKIFILSCDYETNGGGIYGYNISKDSELILNSYFACDRPMYAISDNDKLHVLLRQTFENNSGYFSIDKNFKNKSNIYNTKGEVACHLDVVDGDKYIVNYLSGNVVKNCEKIVCHTGKGYNKNRQDAPHTHFCKVVDGDYVLVADLGIDTVFVYDRNLNKISSAKVPAGFGVRHLVVSNDNRTVYAVNELVPSVSVFDFVSGNIICQRTTLFNVQNKNTTGSAIRISNSGEFLYLSLREENCILVIKVQKNNLEIVQKISCQGDSPRDIQLYEDKYLVCCNEKTNNVILFSLREGLIDKVLCEEKVNKPLCCVI